MGTIIIVLILIIVFLLLGFVMYLRKANKYKTGEDGQDGFTSLNPDGLAIGQGGPVSEQDGSAHITDIEQYVFLGHNKERVPNPYPIPEAFGLNDLDVRIEELQRGLVRFTGYLGESFQITLDELEQIQNSKFLQLRQQLSTAAYQYKTTIFPLCQELFSQLANLFQDFQD